MASGAGMAQQSGPRGVRRRHPEESDPFIQAAPPGHPTFSRPSLCLSEKVSESGMTWGTHQLPGHSHALKVGRKQLVGWPKAPEGLRMTGCPVSPSTKSLGGFQHHGQH